jgi:uncharacterized protein YjbI with pentapeptide repeats
MEDLSMTHDQDTSTPWLKRNLWKIGIAIAVVLALLLVMVWIVRLVADANEVASRTVTITSQVDATAVAQDYLKQQDKQLQRNNSISWAFLSAIGSSLGAGIGGIGTMFLAFAAFRTASNGFKQWQGNREDDQRKRDEEQKRWQKEQEEERRKRDEERFQSVVEGLGSEREETRIGAAIMLRTFLRPGYEQFYIQTFDLAVAHLRLPRTSDPLEDPNAAQPLTTLSQALIVVFKEVFYRARRPNERDPQFLDATGIQLDCAYLQGVDLKQAWMPRVSLRNSLLMSVDLSRANLRGANLSGADLCEGVDLRDADLRGANLNFANLRTTKLSRAYLHGASLRGSDLRGSDLRNTNLSGIDFRTANLSGAYLINVDLDDANLSGVDLSRTMFSAPDPAGNEWSSRTSLTGANLSFADLRGTSLEGVNLDGTDLRGVKGLTEEQLATCKANGAIIDENPATNSSQPTVATLPPSFSNDVQPSSVLLAEENIPDPNGDGNSPTPPASQPS